MKYPLWIKTVLFFSVAACLPSALAAAPSVEEHGKAIFQAAERLYVNPSTRDQAVVDLLLFLELFPDHPQSARAHLYLGNYYAAQGQLESATIHHDALLARLEALSPEQQAEALYFSAAVKFRLNQADAAETLLSRLLKDHADSPYAADGHFLRGEVLLQRKDWEAALQEFQAYVQTAPKSERGKLSQAFAHLEQIVQQQPDLAGKVTVQREDYLPAGLQEGGKRKHSELMLHSSEANNAALRPRLEVRYRTAAREEAAELPFDDTNSADSMLLCYIPFWRHHHLDNFCLAGPDRELLGLVRFDLDALRLPKDAELTAATLKMYVYEPGLYSRLADADLARVGVYPVLEPWQEAAVSWNNRPKLGEVAVTAEIDGSEGWKSFDVTALVGAWRSGEQENHGIALRLDEVNGDARIAADEAANEAIAAQQMQGVAAPAAQPAVAPAGQPAQIRYLYFHSSEDAANLDKTPRLEIEYRSKTRLTHDQVEDLGEGRYRYTLSVEDGGVEDAVILSYMPQWGFNDKVDFIAVGSHSADAEADALIRFDLTALDLPQDAEILAARLKLHVHTRLPSSLSAQKTAEFAAFRVTSEWSEATNWETRPQVDETPFPVRLDGSVGWKEWDLTEMFRQWWEDEEENFGVMLKLVSLRP